LLPGGEVLDVERGQTTADHNGVLDIVLSDRTARIQVPPYRMPRYRKCRPGTSPRQR